MAAIIASGSRRERLASLRTPTLVIHGDADILIHPDAGRHTAALIQNAQAEEVLVLGQSGLVTLSPPWCKASYEKGRVIMPNGAQAFIYTPVCPKDIFGPEHHLAWATELHAWPHSTMELAWSNLRMGVRLGYGRIVWDTNPAKRNPIITELIDPPHSSHLSRRRRVRRNRG